MNEEAVPVAAPSFIGNHTVLNVAEIKSMPLLHLETRPNAWPDWFNQNNLTSPTNRGMVLEQFSMVTQAAIAGMGVAMLPHFLINTELERGELELLIDTPLKNSAGYHLVTPKNYKNYAPVVALRNWLLDQTVV
jgi:DNA-binding transcriptional LysR family regulator